MPKSQITYGADADLAAEQMKLQRQQAIADALRKQAITPLQTPQNNGNQTSKISPWAVLGQLAQAYSAKNLDEESDAKQQDLAAEGSRRRAAALRSALGLDDAEGPVTPPGPPLAAAPSAGAVPVEGLSLGTAPGAAALPDGLPSVTGAPKATRSPEAAKRLARALNMYENIDPELGRKLLENQLAQTTEQRNMEAMGQDPSLMGALGVAKGRKDAMFEQQPGTTATNMMTGERTVLPKLGEGMVQGPGGAVDFAPNYEQSATRLAGALKGAEAGAGAQFDMVTVPTPQGPRMMTRAQAAQMAGGVPGAQPPAAPPVLPPAGPVMVPPAQAPNMGFPPGTQLPALSGAATPDARLQILQNERAKIAQRGNAADLAAIDREIANVTRAGAPAMGGPTMGAPGIPLKPTLEGVREEAEAKADATVYQNRQQTYRDELDKANKQYDEMMSAIPEARNALKIATGSGVGEVRDKVQGFFGKSTPPAQAAAKLDVLGAKFVGTVPRFEGPQSNTDVAFYKSAAADVANRSLPNETRLAALDTMENMQRYANAIANKRQTPEPAWRSTDRYKSLAPQAPRGRPAANATPDQILQFYLQGGQ